MPRFIFSSIFLLFFSKSLIKMQTLITIRTVSAMSNDALKDLVASLTHSMIDLSLFLQKS